MQLTAVHIENFRALRDITIPMSRFGCLIGENNAGKSSILTALSLFNSGNKLSATDYFKPELPIRVELSMSGLGNADFDRVALKHRERARAMADNGMLTLVRIWSPDGTSRLFQRKMLPKDSKFSADQIATTVEKQKPGKDFAARILVTFPELRDKVTNSTNQTVAKDLIKALAEGLPASEKSMQDAALDTGIDESISGLIPEPIYIAAVKDLANETKTRESTPFGKVLKILLDAIQPDLQSEAKLFETLNAKLNVSAREDGAIIDNRLPKIKEIETTLGRLLSETFSSVTLQLRIPPPDFRTILSNAQIRVNDGVDGNIESKGDGLKRAVVFSILRTWVELSAEKSSKVEVDDSDGNVIESLLGIPEESVQSQKSTQTPYLLLFEEPELYLHPKAQGVLFEALRKFSELHHVMITTHSPSFFGPRATETFVKISKVSDNAVAPIPFTKAQTISLSEISTKQQFQLICYENNSAAFFAKTVVLVEGICDEIVLSHLGRLLDPQWDCSKHPVAIAQIGGKSAIGLYRKFFVRFDIRVAVVADLDVIIRGFEHLDAGSSAGDLRSKLMQYLTKCIEINNIKVNSEGLKEAKKSATVRLSWDKLKQEWDALQSDERNREAFMQAAEAFMAWEANDEKLRLLKEASDPNIKSQKDALLQALRDVGVFVL